MSSQNQIKCPNCSTLIDVQDILAHQLEDKIKAEMHGELNKEREAYKKEQERLNTERLEFEAKKKNENVLFEEKLQRKIKEEKALFEASLKSKVQEEQAEQFKAMQSELSEKSEQLKEMQKTRIELERLKREKEEIKEKTMAEAQITINETLTTEKEKIRKQEAEKSELRFKEMQKQLDDQKNLTEEMKRKQEQGSMQLQGEVQELAIEEWLMAQFPLDTIEEIKKGARGGDCIQVVNTRAQQNCGKIYYESKRTKDFQPSWIEKFKADMRVKSADVGVLVTEAMPSGMEQMGMRDGIWICTYTEFKGLCIALRELVVQLNTAMLSQDNKGDKMNMLYDFLTGNTFKMQIEAIVEGFTQMQSDMDAEKRSMNRIWKQREKQLEKVLINTVDMHASIKGIAGNAIQSIALLEFPHANEIEGESEE